MTTPRTAPDVPDAASTRRQLNVLLVIGLLDFALLLVLVFFAFVHRDDGAVSVLGPIHGVGYIILVVLCALGAYRKRWGWWFPLIVLITAGPPGTIIGDVLLRRRTAA